MSNRSNKPPDHEITYQVGWKKGTIQLTQDRSAHSSKLHLPPLLIETWRPLPFLPIRLLLGIIVVLPLVGTVAMVWLIALLVRAM